MSRKTSKYRVRFHRGVKYKLATQERVVQNTLRNELSTRNEPVFSFKLDDGDFVQNSIKKIREWSIIHNITQRALSDLLKILKTHLV